MKKPMLMGSFLLIVSLSYAQSDAELTRSTLSKSTIEGHIYFLASDELKGRETGSPEIDIAAQYIANTFRIYGVQPVPGAENGYFQPVHLEKTKPAEHLSLTIGDFATDELLMLKGQNTELSGEVIFLNYGMPDDYQKVDAKGKIIVVRSGSEGKAGPNDIFGLAREKRQVAVENGAVALVELTQLKGVMWGRFKRYLSGEKLQARSQQTNDLIHVWTKGEADTFEKIAKKNAQGQITISGMDRTAVPSKNVVGMVEGTDPDLKEEFVIYSAHYDHIGIGQPNNEGDSIYNGARDNAVGTVTVLSAAENIARHPTKRSALFILFTAEEKGLLGSEWYVDNPLIPLDKVVYCFNSDNGGYNDTSVATIIGLERTTASENIKSACTEFGLEAIDDPAPEQGLFDRSDNVHFAASGIPAPTFSLGFRAFDAEIFKYYHQASDNPDNLDYDYLTKFFGAYVLACRKIANDPVTPFWVKGDKYHEAGEALYGDK